MRTKRREKNPYVDGAPQLVQLWMHRVLFNLNMHKKFITAHGFDDLEMAHALEMADFDTQTDINDDAEDYSGFDEVKCLRELKRRCLKLETRSHELGFSKELDSNIQQISELVGLNGSERILLGFVVSLKTNSVLQTACGLLGGLTTLAMSRHLSIILNLPLDDVNEALRPQGILNRSGILRVDRRSDLTMDSRLDLLSNEFADTVSSSVSNPIDFIKAMVAPSTPAHLGMADYEHISDQIAILKPYLAHALQIERGGVNILIYGAPGTGKSQFVKAISESLSVELFNVSTEDEDGDSVQGQRRLSAYALAQHFFAKRKAILLFDEVEDVFSSDGRFHQSPAQSRKAWMNRLLEKNHIPTFWVSNSIDDIEPAFIRRFDMIFELPVPPKKQRRKIIQASCAGLITDKTIERLTNCEDLSPAVVTRTAAVCQCLQDELGASNVDRSFELMVNSTLSAQGHKAIPKNAAGGLPSFYDAALTNANEDLLAIAQGIKQAGFGRLCLYGASGTGKTAYGRWMAEYLNKPLILIKASDLMDKFLGETERKIAQVFAQAERDDAVLLIDEVDSFLQDRRNAVRSWEVSQVNEMLTQIECYSGIFIASTNLIDNIDQAALRRFDLKAKFDYLKSNQAEQLLSKYVTELGLKPATEQDLSRLKSTKVLTPGDFSAVHRQSRFRPFKNATELIAALESECRLKENKGKSMGFVS